GTRRPVEGGRRVDCGLLSLIGIPLRQVVRERHRGRRGRGGVRWRVLRRQGLQCGGAGARTGRKGRFWTWSGCLCNDRGSGRRLGERESVVWGKVGVHGYQPITGPNKITGDTMQPI